MIITKTPFRMSFFGGGTDIQSFFNENEGAVLSTTFDKYCYVTVRHLPRFFDYTSEFSYAKMERVNTVDDIEHPAIRNAMKMLDMHEIRLTYEADLPARSGLGTSSSFAVGMLNAFHALKGNIKETNMKDTTFYQALFRCYLPNREATPNCRQCPLFAQGHSPNDECRRMLNDEIRRRKCEAQKKEAV